MSQHPGFEEITYGGLKQMAFIVHKGEEKWLVIPAANITPIDYKRFREVAKFGGDPLSVMRDMTLDNGRNALVQYDSWIRSIDNPTKPVAEATEAVATETTAPATTTKRTRGRGKASA